MRWLQIFGHSRWVQRLGLTRFIAWAVRISLVACFVVLFLVACAPATTSTVAKNLVQSKPTAPQKLQTVYSQKMYPVFCQLASIFEGTIGQYERQTMMGVMPQQEKYILEVWQRHSADQEQSWTIIIRAAKNDEICILAFGNQLVPTQWFIERLNDRDL